MSLNRKDSNRRIRQDALREQLSNGKHVEHVIDIIKKVEDGGGEFSSLDLQRYKLVIDTKLSLIKKYLPDVKQVEITGEDGEDIKIDGKFVIEIVRPD